MNTRNFERQLEGITAPAPEPAARVRARQAALAEFGRLHPGKVRQASRGWQIPRLWLGGVATTAVAVIGVAVVWNVPEAQRQLPVAADEPTVAPEVRIALESAPGTASAAPTATAPVPAPEVAVIAESRPQLSRLPTSSTSTADAALTQVDAAGIASKSEAERTLLAAAGSEAPAAVAASPVATITREQMEQLGVINAADALTMLTPRQTTVSPQTAPATSPQRDDRPSYFIGNTIANLRGIDPAFGNRTLTLVDGSRVVGTGALPPTGAVAAAAVNATAGIRYLIPAEPAAGDRFEQIDTNPVKRVVDAPVSTFSIDVDTASYSFARRMLNQGTLPPADAVRVEEMINYFDYAWPAAQSRTTPFRPTVTVSDSPWSEGRKLVHIGIKGYEVPARGRPDVNLVLLVDVSGSMNSADKLPLAQQSIKLLLDSLKPTDTVAIAVYAGAAGEVLAPTPVRERERIVQAIDALRSGGSTAGAQGIRLAYELAQRGFRENGVNRILLATDGDFNVGTSSTEELRRLVERERQRGVRLSVLGFGQGNYRDDIAQALAQNGNGVAAYIDTLAEARKVLVEQAGASLFTIASDVKIQVEFNPATVAEYRLVGYETRALNREDFNNDRVDAGDVGSGHTVTAIYEITPAGSRAVIDERRYATEQADARVAGGRTDEYGYLKLRYKLPGEDESRLLEQAIRTDAGVPRQLRQEVAFSTAVAGFAQLLRGGEHTGRLTYADVIEQASPALGDDPYEYRADFLELVRKARQIQEPGAAPSPRSVF